MREQDALAVIGSVHLVARLEAAALKRLVERNVSGGARHVDRGRGAFALGLVFADEHTVPFGEIECFAARGLVVCQPCVRAFHRTFLLTAYVAKCR